LNGDSENDKAVTRSSPPAVGHFAATARPGLLEDPRARAGAVVVVALLAAAAIAALAALGAARTERAEARRLTGELERLTATGSELTELRMRADVAEARAEELDLQVRRLLAPAAGVPVVDVTPVADGGDPAELVLSRRRDLYAILRLDLGGGLAREGVRVRLRDRDGAEIWSAEGVASDATGRLNVLVPALHLPAGLVGAEVEGPVSARYRLLVRPAP